MSNLLKYATHLQTFYFHLIKQYLHTLLKGFIARQNQYCLRKPSYDLKANNHLGLMFISQNKDIYLKGNNLKTTLCDKLPSTKWAHQK